MVPLHDSDLANERWSQAEWENYELWEKVELRLQRKKRIWIAATVFVFILLSAVPITVDRWPKWTTRIVARHLAQEMNRIKREASIDRAAYRLKFNEDEKLAYTVEKVPNCNSSQGEVVRSGAFLDDSTKNKYVWLSTSKGSELGIPGLVGEFCYDYLLGSDAVFKGDSITGIGIIPANDLTLKRLDRLTLLIFSGPSAEISFD